jgi:cardiolipin synthase
MSILKPAEPVFLPGNRLQLLASGTDYFPALIAAIDAAQHEVHLETYIFANDVTGRAVASALSAAARRGVNVRVLVDGFGARDFATGLGVMLTTSGVEVLVYRPEATRLRLRRHRLRRMHRKLAVIDGCTAFVGGINILDDFDDGAATAPRFDYAIRIEGALVARIHAAVRHVWRLVRWARIGRGARRPPRPLPLAPCGNTAPGTVLAALLIRDNLRHRRDIENAYLDAIAAARDEIIIANAYFLPGRTLRRALIDAARRGVKVTLLLQGRVEYMLQHYATRTLYARLLKAGVRIFEYRPAFLHAKVAVIDTCWATVGSSNIDPFSLLLAREANVVVRDAAFAAELRASLMRALTDAADEISQENHRQRAGWEQLTGAVAYWLVRVLVSVTRYGGQYSR